MRHDGHKDDLEGDRGLKSKGAEAPFGGGLKQARRFLLRPNQNSERNLNKR
jgi:hypothetical protein